MKIYIISGEPSGDLQASKLMAECNELDTIEWRGIGGDKMINQGLSPLYHMKDMAFFGFFEVIKHLPNILERIKNTKNDILNFSPDVIIFIDYPGFNLKIAKFTYKNNIKSIYYITPQLWAWHKSRVKLMKKYINQIINIFPFEVDFYNSYGIKSYYYGHPLTEGLKVYNFKKNSPSNVQKIGILPGSRLSEINNLLPTMMKAVLLYSQQKSIEVSIGKVPHVEEKIYLDIINKYDIDVKICDDKAYEIMYESDFLIMSSGTATLEAACYHTPMIVCYKLSKLTSLIVKYVVKIKNICLVNIVAGKRVVPELIHESFTAKNILIEIDNILSSRSELVNDLIKVHNKLATKNVSKNVALHVQRYIASLKT